jgi:hypothetical protein
VNRTPSLPPMSPDPRMPIFMPRPAAARGDDQHLSVGEIDKPL